MLDAGRLIHSAPLDPPGEGDRLSVEVFGDPRILVEALTRQGVSATLDGTVVTVVTRSEDAFVLMRDALESTGSSVRRLGTSLSRLEDVLVAAAREANG